MRKLLLELMGRFSFGLSIIVLAAIFTGCSSGGNSYSQYTARQHITDWLESKYEEEFKITTVEKRVYGNGSTSGPNYYYYEATSKNTGVSFEGTTSCSYEQDKKYDYKVSDRYEEALYGKQLNDEVASITNSLDKWGRLECEVLASDSRYTGRKSQDYKAFKSDTSKVHISVNLYLEEEESEDMLRDLYNYTNRLYAINNDVNLTIYRGEDGPSSTLHTKNASVFNYQYFLDNMS